MAIDPATPAGAADPAARVRLPIVDESARSHEHPIYRTIERMPGLSLATASIDELLTWGLTNSLWIFPMATSCCGIELMAAAASRVDIDRMGSIVRASPRQADVMVMAGTLTVKMAPRVKKLWEQMPEPKWCIAMGSCAISGDFYRNLYSVVPGIDTVVPVDVYVPGCPPSPEGLMHGLLRLQEKVRAQRQGRFVPRELNPALIGATNPSVPRLRDPARDPATGHRQEESALHATERDVLIAHDREVASTDTHEAEAALCESQSGHDDMAAPAFPLGQGSISDQAIIDLLQREFGVTDIPADGPPVVAAARHLELAQRLVGMGYRQLVYLVASHWPEGRGRAGAAADEPEHFEVAYGLRTVGPGSRIAGWSLRLAPGERAPSLVGLLAGADWQEREQFDLLGVEFAGHPDLRRILLPEGWNGHPLRRDYPADAHVPPWR